jgi:hypothetical protein
MDPVLFLNPFLDVIRCEVVTGPVTGQALVSCFVMMMQWIKIHETAKFYIFTFGVVIFYPLETTLPLYD